MYIIITGATRGIGYALCEDALVRGDHVLAVGRNLNDSKLKKLEEKYTKLSLLSLDLEADGSSELIANSVDHWPHVDILINNAGRYESDETVEKFQKSFLINTIKPFFITKALITKLKLSSNPRSVQISSIMGSIGNLPTGGSYSYRSSKTALNMIFKNLSIDEPWLTVLQFHPGWVQTRMGGEGATLSVSESSKGLWTQILSSELKDSGSFKDYRGENIPW